VRAVVGHHGVEVALQGLLAADLAQAVAHAQVGHEAAFLEAVGVVLQGADVGLHVHVGIHRRAHHARWVHLDRLKVHSTYFHPGAGLGFSDGVFLSAEHRSGEQGAERHKGRA